MRSPTCSLVLLAATALAGCATFKPPQISYDDPPQPAVLETEPPKPVQVVEVPKLLPLPGQLKPLPGPRAAPEPRDPRQRVDLANAAARVQPTRRGYLNAVQVYPFADGALYQVYAAPGQVTDIALQEGEQLVGSGPVAAGDTVRWIIGDTESGTPRPRRFTSWSSRPAPNSSPTSSSTPTGAPITSSFARPKRPTWRRSPGSIRRTNSLRCVARMHGPTPRPRSRRRSTSTICAFATRSTATIRPGGRCAPSMTARRSTSSSRAGSPRARCRRCSSSAPRARRRARQLSRARPAT